MSQTNASLRVLGIAGSLRKGSFNRALLRAAQELAPEGMVVTPFDLAPIPLYDGDMEARGVPGPVAALKQAIREADALLIATPEYNYSVPGVLKNAVDWASRPTPGSGERVLQGKPAAIMSASPGMLGGARAQYHLRQSFVFTQTQVLLSPEVMVAQAGERFDAQGRLTDEGTRERVRSLLEALADWTWRLRTARQGEA